MHAVNIHNFEDKSFARVHVQPSQGNVRGLVELTESEIDLVSGGIDWTEVGQAAFVGLVSGGIGGAVGGAAVGALAGGVGAAPGAFTGFVGGAIGGAVTGAIVSIMDQTLNK